MPNILANLHACGKVFLVERRNNNEGAYKNMAYTSGDVTIKWSPDTYGSVPSLN